MDNEAFDEEFSKPEPAPLAEKPKDDPFEFDTSSETAKAGVAEGLKDERAMPSAAQSDAPPKSAAPEEAAPQAKPRGFRDTFAAQRKSGAKVFEWNGQKYSTALVGASKAKAAPGAAPTLQAPGHRGPATPAPAGRVADTPIANPQTQAERDTNQRMAMESQPLVKIAKSIGAAFSAGSPRRSGNAVAKS